MPEVSPRSREKAISPPSRWVCRPFPAFLRLRFCITGCKGAKPAGKGLSAVAWGTVPGTVREAVRKAWVLVSQVPVSGVSRGRFRPASRSVKPVAKCGENGGQTCTSIEIGTSAVVRNRIAAAVQSEIVIVVQDVTLVSSWNACDH
jgi:hypothetical protein